MSLTVATVLRSGAEYSPEWAHRLRRQVNEHLGAPHNFVCLTDMEVPGVETRELVHDFPGYWSKMELYREGLFDGRVIYLDLDTLVIGDIAPLAEYDGAFAALRDFGDPRIQASGILLLDGRDPPPLYRMALEERPRMRRNARTDLWWNRHLKADVIQDIVPPGFIQSYKMHGLEDGPNGASVVCFHGTPRQHEFGPGHWVTRAWKAAA